MDDKSFYDVLDEEIDAAANTFKDNEFLKKVKDNVNATKSFSFLYWFLERYLPNKDFVDFENYITEGEDDSSCDLIFSNENHDGKEVFYVVQAKWFEKGNISKSKGLTKEIKACLSDFNLIKSGKKSSTLNDKFNIQYQKLIDHKNKNGKIKFIFLALCNGDINIRDYVDDFISNMVSFELMDFQKIKEQYVELKYKGVRTHNPLEKPYYPISELNLKIEKDQIIKINNPYESYILIIKPKEIYILFEKYGNSLFAKNIRNPLVGSLFNKEIEDTILNNPKSFWYFNNGITAITDEINDFYEDSDNITIKGIQVINGAQTVYSVYQAYKYASEDDKNQMDSDGRITIRLVTTGGKDFDLKVTRFTNSQNPVNERDFHANDEVQIRLQKDFLKKTNVWYETRRGEFSRSPRNVLKIRNEDLGQSYLAYYLTDPFNAKQNKKLIFVSSSINKNGLYEKIFNQNTAYDDMLVAYYLHSYIDKERKDLSKIIKNIDTSSITKDQESMLDYDFVQYAGFEILSLLKILFYHMNENKKQLNSKLITYFEKNTLSKISKSYDSVKDFIKYDMSIKKANNSCLLYTS